MAESTLSVGGRSRSAASQEPAALPAREFPEPGKLHARARCPLQTGEMIRWAAKNDPHPLTRSTQPDRPEQRLTPGARLAPSRDQVPRSAVRNRFHCKDNHQVYEVLLVTPGRLELPTCGLGNHRSIHLSYGAITGALSQFNSRAPGHAGGISSSAVGALLSPGRPQIELPKFTTPSKLRELAS